MFLKGACSHIARPHRAVGGASDSRARTPGFDTRSGHILSFLLPVISRREVVSYWQRHVQEVLVNRLGLRLIRKIVVRLTDHPDMTIAVYGGCKTTQHVPIHLKAC